MPEKNAKRELAKLLHLHQRLLDRLQGVRDEIRAPETMDLLKEIRRRTGNETGQNVQVVASAVEEAMRGLKVSRSELRSALDTDPVNFSIDGVDNLPLALARFLAERRKAPGFSFEVLQDDVRGWVIRWKEVSSHGVVRGCGQFYERPYAWLED